MPTQHEVIIEAFKVLGGVRTIGEIRDWVRTKYGDRWKDFGTRMADMVPQELGGNPSSNVRNEFRVLRRVSIGKYRLIADKIPEEQKHSNIRQTVRSFMSHSEEVLQRNSQSNLYVILPGSKSVEVWSAERLPFEPEGWLKRLRRDICSAIRGIYCGPSQLLHAVYVSPIRERCDVENILFYNVGIGCFPRSDNAGLRFERVFSQPPAIPRPMNRPALHYHHYESVAKETGFKHWIPTKTLVRWRARIRTRFMTVLPNPAAHIWYWMKSGSTELITKPHHVPTQFGLSMTIYAPSGSVSNLVALLKPLLDGAVAAFHQHDGTMQAEVASRLARVLGVRTQDVVAHLSDNTNAVLGRRRLLWPWRNSIQWNPADDCCVAGELLFIGSTKDFLELSGELFEVRETVRTCIDESCAFT
ncbi:hypothetical protein IBX38_08815 [Candidatus Bathyarchaeota archaeon]|nr:hypothetical protein [Candidatus Bathyarchaeota archaeon]